MFRPGVDFLNVFRSAKSIEIALSIFAVRRRPTLSHEFEAKSWMTWRKGENRLREIDPWTGLVVVKMKEIVESLIGQLNAQTLCYT